MKFSIKLKLFAASHIKREGGEEHHHDSDIDGIKHKQFQPSGAAAPERDNATISIWVNLKPRTSRIRGSPFQMPTRLADGLGLESGLESGCPASFAPSAAYAPELVPPHPASGRKPDLGCNGQSKSQSPGFVKCRMNTAFFEGTP